MVGPSRKPTQPDAEAIADYQYLLGQANSNDSEYQPYNNGRSSRNGSHVQLDIDNPGSEARHGRLPQLSASFYEDAAAALSAGSGEANSNDSRYNSGLHSPVAQRPQQRFEMMGSPPPQPATHAPLAVATPMQDPSATPAGTTALNAYMPSLLQSPYEASSAASSSGYTPAPEYEPTPVHQQGQSFQYAPQYTSTDQPAPHDDYKYETGNGVDGYEYAQGYSAPGAQEYIDDEAELKYRAASPHSQYGDQTEVAHTPMPLPYEGNYGRETPATMMPSHDLDGETYHGHGYGYENEKMQDAYAPDAAYYGEGDDDENEGAGDVGAGIGADTMHFGPAPARGAQLRRNKTRKNVRLTQGNLILDCPIPTKLEGFLSRRGEEEFMSMRYTAATCDPNDYSSSMFNLRPALLNRHTEIFIAITLYNEDEVLFCRTLHGVMKNIAHLCSRHKSRTWGPDGWKKVVVCIIADGRKKVHPRVLDVLASLGVYQDGVAKNVVNGKEVSAHIYEYTSQLSIDSNLQFKGAERGLVPTQIIFCMKEHNQKKINSHRWFFNAFGPILQPNVCILLDAGTRPEPKSIYHLWKTFDLNSNVAGACGEITADVRGKWGLGPALLNPIVASQNFEYKVSNILDKTTESVAGYISVLPGAFSAYRYIALQNDEMGLGPLATYFKGETMQGPDVDLYTANIFLAEDRILCFELAAKRNESWVLRYVKSARGVTDVPDRLPEFISQRRRWLNGSFFAAVYSLTHTRQFLSSGHSASRKAMLLLEMTYNFVNLAFAWFSLANFYIFFRILTQSLESPSFNIKHIDVFNTIVQYIYLGTTIGCFILALGNRPQGSNKKYVLAACIYATLTVYMMVCALICLIKAIKEAKHNAIYAQMIFSVLATYGVYIVSSLIALDPLHLLTSFLQYILLAPTYINVLNTYAFCNIHDFSWGTKGATTVNNDLGSVTSSSKDGVVEVQLPTTQADIDSLYDKSLHNLRTRPMIIKGAESLEEKEMRRLDFYRNIRTDVLLAWVLSNGALAALILSGNNTGTFDSSSGITRSKVYMLLILVFVGALSVVRFTGSTIFMIMRLVAG